MIRYTLACDQGHDFESWFRDSDAFEAQKKRKLVSCPMCHSVKIDKTIMAPQIARKDRDHAPRDLLPIDQPTMQAPEVTSPAVLLGDKERELRAMMGEIREKILSVTDDVGDSFAREARAMAEGETDERPIRGTATAQEWRDLVEDGIGVLPLPELPEDRH